jgi:hypothetical protein
MSQLLYLNMVAAVLTLRGLAAGATAQGLDGWESRFDSRQGLSMLVFSTPSRPTLLPTQPPM